MSTSPARNAIVTYETEWETNCVAWSSVAQPQRLAVSSYVPDGPNHISIVEKNPASDHLERVGQIKYFYPPTKIQFAPRAALIGREHDLLAVSSDFLRLWDIQDSAGPAITGGSNTIGSNTGDDVQGEQRIVTPVGDGRAGTSGAATAAAAAVVPIDVIPPSGVTDAVDVVQTLSSSSAFRRLQVEQWRLFKRTRPPGPGGAAGAAGGGGSGGGGMSAASIANAPGARGSSAAAVAPPPGTTHGHHPATGADDFCDPVTSFDWNRDKPSMIAETNTDTTISVWDIVAEVLTIQLIAHDKPVFDCSFASGESVFASCGADGSVRVFDLRSMENCTIVYEDPRDPILRVAWSACAPYIAATVAESPHVVIIDMRNPSTPVCVHANHDAPVNSIAWHPHFGQTLCCVGEDKRALIWEINNDQQSAPTPQMTYDASAPINGVAWSSVHDEWVSITSGNKVSVLLV